MKPGWAYLRVSLWTVALLALGYGFAKTQGGFVGWYLFAVVAVIFAYEWTVVLFGRRGWRVEVTPVAESAWTGEDLEVELTWRRPWWNGWLTWAHLAVDSVSVRWVVPPGECRGSRRVRTGPLARGEYPLSPVVIEVSDFFGLYHVRRELPGGPTVQVYPQPLTDPAVLRHRRG
ncbi:MAG: hypothetical protein IRY98_11755, partial [Alicyclobacillaceae bacterium]|nr:hypothetical protein [Alicyclobacillaceae bacterium]